MPGPAGARAAPGPPAMGSLSQWPRFRADRDVPGFQCDGRRSVSELPVIAACHFVLSAGAGESRAVLWLRRLGRRR